MPSRAVDFGDIVAAAEAYCAAVAEGWPPGCDGVTGRRSAVSVAHSALGLVNKTFRGRMSIAAALGLDVAGWPVPEMAEAEAIRRRYRHERPEYRAWLAGPGAAEARRAARAGEVAGPPIPEVGRPPAGFAVRRNSASYDADGRLLRQHVQIGRDAGEPHALPAGHMVKGESALLDADGRVVQRWVKTREGAAGAGLVEALREAFAAHEGAAPPVPAPISADADLLTVYPLADLHLGMYAWGRETGDPYDTEIATARAVEGVSRLAVQSPASGRAVLLGLGDYFHANDGAAVTPASKHRLDVDGRWPRVFAAGARLAIALVDLLAQRHAELEVVFLPGNHDPDAAVCLTVALALHYRGQPRITVREDPGLAWYARHGAVLLGATHGHTMKPDRMAMMLAADRPADWGETHHRHFFFGHVHSETAREVGPVRVESLQTPAGRDAWSQGAGYRAGQSLTAVTFHREHGEVSRHRVAIVPARTRVRVPAGRAA